MREFVGLLGMSRQGIVGGGKRSILGRGRGANNDSFKGIHSVGRGALVDEWAGW